MHINRKYWNILMIFPMGYMLSLVLFFYITITKPWYSSLSNTSQQTILRLDSVLEETCNPCFLYLPSRRVPPFLRTFCWEQGLPNPHYQWKIWPINMKLTTLSSQELWEGFLAVFVMKEKHSSTTSSNHF